MEKLRQQIVEAVEAFASNDLAYSDNTLMVIDPREMTASLLDPDEDEDTDALVEADADHDYVAVMDLVEADPANPGRWVADMDVIDALAGEYHD